VDVTTALQMFGEAVIALAAIVGNLLVLVAIATVTSLQTVTNYYVGSLAAADLLVGLLGKCCLTLHMSAIFDSITLFGIKSQKLTVVLLAVYLHTLLTHFR